MVGDLPWNGHFKVDRAYGTFQGECVFESIWSKISRWSVYDRRPSKLERSGRETSAGFREQQQNTALRFFSTRPSWHRGAKRARRTTSSTVVCTRVAFERLAENNTASSPFPVTLDTARTEWSLRMSFVSCSFDSAESNGVLHRFERSIRFRFHPTVPR